MNLEKFQGSNMMGFRRLWVVKSADVQEVSRPVDKKVIVTLKPGRQWSEVYFTIETGKLKVTHKEDDAGDFFDISAAISVPKVQAATLQTLSELKPRRMLIKVLNNNQEEWLIGTLSQPLKMLYSTDQSWNSSNAIEVVFFTPESDTHPYLIEETVSGGAFSNGFSNGYAI